MDYESDHDFTQEWLSILLKIYLRPYNLFQLWKSMTDPFSFPSPLTKLKLCKNVHFTNDKEEDIHGFANIKSSEHFGMHKLAKINLS